MLVALGSCARGDRVPPTPALPVPPPTETPATALEAGVAIGPELASLRLAPSAAEAALVAFRLTCPDVTRREDVSGLTVATDWVAACDAAARPVRDARAFFDDQFRLVAIGDGRAFATGYYEPEISGSRVRAAGYPVPVYARPPDLLDRDPATGEARRGRLDENGRFVPYFDRAAIDAGALAGRGLEIAWVADPVDLFFLQIQGSGRIRLPDGGVMRIGYAGQNGHAYVAIGRLMRERGLIESPVTMQAIQAWLRRYPAQGRALMHENPSYVFFHELTGPGPLGALGRPVTPRVSVAADPRFVPLGAPVVLMSMEDDRADGLWVAQDTGGAIRGANRFDTFWGAGEEAARIAGGMSASGRAWLLLPRASVDRLMSGRASPQR